MSDGSEADDVSIARRRLLRVGAYTAPLIIATLSMTGRANAASCSPTCGPPCIPPGQPCGPRGGPPCGPPGHG